MLSLFALSLLTAQCDKTQCPIPPPMTAAQAAAVKNTPPYWAEIEVISRRTQTVVHRASGLLTWNQKKHLGGQDLRGTGFDAPDYEINSRLLRPREVWVST